MKEKISTLNLIIFLVGIGLSTSTLASTQMLCDIGQNSLFTNQLKLTLTDSYKVLISLPSRNIGYGAYKKNTNPNQVFGIENYLIRGELSPGIGVKEATISINLFSNGRQAQGKGVIWSNGTEQFLMQCSVDRSSIENKANALLYHSLSSQKKVSCCHINCNTGGYYCQNVPEGTCVQHMCH